jgi:hypothetical protein
MSQIQAFDYSLDLLRVIPWQYNKAVRLLTWLQNKQNYANSDHTDFWNNWYRDVFDVNTVNPFGASVWSIILDIPQINQGSPREPNSSWGFGQFRKNYNNGNFNPSSGGQFLTLEQKRIIIKMRYKQLISRGTIPEINAIMNEAWGDVGNSYCLDNYDMTIEYRFDFTPSDWIIYAIQTLELLPRPSAVRDSIVDASGWILSNGVWNDFSIWDDSETWNDGP